MKTNPSTLVTSPTPKSQKIVSVQGTGISNQRSEAELKTAKARKEKLQLEEKKLRSIPLTKPEATKKKDGVKTITEADYRIESGGIKLEADMISISARISSGPRFNDMLANPPQLTITA